MTLPPTPDNVPDDHLVVFIGHSSDANPEAALVRGLEHELQGYLDRMVNNHRSPFPPFSRIHFWEWSEDASPGKGGQEHIKPFIQRADIAVFVFKGRMGRVTWDELQEVRTHHSRTAYVIALFPANAPDDIGEEGTAAEWAELLQRRRALFANWTERDSVALLPLPPFQDHDALKTLALDHLSNSVDGLWQQCPARPTAPAAATADPPVDTPEGGFVAQWTDITEYDAQAVHGYREHLRASELAYLPNALPNDGFLDKGGFRRNGRLNRVGVLLFTPRPDHPLPGAATQCTLYHGETQAASRMRDNFNGPAYRQIEEAFNFVQRNINRTEAPDGQSARSATTYPYPMEAVREVIANALCHRDYQLERLTYIRIFSDRIEVANPGEWAAHELPGEGPGIPLGQLAGQSIAPNHPLARAIAAIDLVEMEGSGVPRSLADCEAVGAPEPDVRKEDGYVVVTLYPGPPQTRGGEWNLPRIRREGILRELADLFDDEASALALLERIEFPRRHLLTFGCPPDQFWQEVCREITTGHTPFGMDTLLSAAADLYPGNRLLAPWRTERPFPVQRSDLPKLRYAVTPPQNTAQATPSGEVTEANLYIYGVDDVHTLIDTTRERATGINLRGASPKVELVFASVGIVCLHITNIDSESAATLRDEMQVVLADTHPEALVELAMPGFRPYLYRRLYLEGPDQSRFELESVPSTVRIADIAMAGISEYDEAMWPRDQQDMRRLAIIEHVPEGDVPRRLDPDKTLDECGIEDGDTLHIAPESTPGCFPPDTPVVLADGTEIAIGEIEEGMELRLGTPARDGRRTGRVLAVERRTVEWLVWINERIRVSESQPLYTGRAARQVRELHLGDTLLDGRGREFAILSLRRESGEFEVCNLVLEGAQDTFIANDTVAYHMHARDELAEFLEAMGIESALKALTPDETALRERLREWYQRRSGTQAE